jgi:iron complex outermembrane receptor protein
MTSHPFHRIAALGLAAALSAPAFAQEAPPAAEPVPAPAPSDIEEIVVTGSYIKGTPEDAALPVDVTSFDDLQEQGAPSIAELVRNLAYTSGNLAETNQSAYSLPSAVRRSQVRGSPLTARRST